MAGDVPTFTDDNFEAEVVNSDLPVVVDLWADWCAPCRAIGPTVEALSRELAGTIKIGKLVSCQHKSAAYGVVGLLHAQCA